MIIHKSLTHALVNLIDIFCLHAGGAPLSDSEDVTWVAED